MPVLIIKILKNIKTVTSKRIPSWNMVASIVLYGLYNS